MDLNEIVLFIQVVESGSFTKAAQTLGIPKSTLSTKIADLERRVGMTLIKRTTRKLFFTEEGLRLFNESKVGVEYIRNAYLELSSGAKEPQGTLKITAPVELGTVILPKIVEKYRQAYPKVKLELNFSDRRVDLVGEGYDLAIRAGTLKDSSLIAKKLGEVYFAPFATKKFLEKNGFPKTIKDLASFECLQFKTTMTPSWSFENGRQKASVDINSFVDVNDLNALKSLAEKNMGIALLPAFMCYSEVKSGKLVRLFEGWKTQKSPIHFVYPPGRHVSPKVSSFIKIGTEIIKDHLEDIDIEMED